MRGLRRPEGLASADPDGPAESRVDGRDRRAREGRILVEHLPWNDATSPAGGRIGACLVGGAP
jgi:hypothetical protein